MFLSGDILYITDFVFPDGSIRSKYCLLLAKSDQDLLIYTLASSQVHIREAKEGCNPSDLTPFFFIKKHWSIGENGFSFPKDSYLYYSSGNLRNASEVSFSTMSKVSNIEKIDCLENSIHQDILYCVYKSKLVPGRLRPIIEAELARLCE